MLNCEKLVKIHGINYELEIELKAPSQNTMNKNSFDAKEIAVIKCASKTVKEKKNRKKKAIGIVDLGKSRSIAAH